MGNKSSGGQGNEINQNNKEEKFVKSEIDQNCVVVFSKSFCPYCKATKNTFQNMGIDFKVIELDSRSDGNAIQDVLHKITGARTVPRVFINGKSIGGNSDIKKLYDAGKLDELVKSCS